MPVMMMSSPRARNYTLSYLLLSSRQQSDAAEASIILFIRLGIGVFESSFFVIASVPRLSFQTSRRHWGAHRNVFHRNVSILKVHNSSIIHIAILTAFGEKRILKTYLTSD